MELRVLILDTSSRFLSLLGSWCGPSSARTCGFVCLRSRGCAGLESDASGEVGRCGVAAGWVHGFVDGVQSAVGSGTSLERVAEDGAAG